jgi:aminoglycoside phosphotransferase family enzyme/predicted kinase
MTDQQDVIAFLSDGASYGKPGIAVERIETHISIVFLISDRAYKLKRAVRLPYLDYSTAAVREQFCRAELELNRRTAPAMYLRVRGIGREAHGNLIFDDGSVIDWVLEMRRFSQDDLFDQLAESRKLTPQLMRDLTDVIVGFHVAAEATPAHGGCIGTGKTIDGNNANLTPYCPPLEAAHVEQLYAASIAKLSSIGALLDARRDAGKVRRCHGDLHLRNICLFDARPTPFDCIEFSDALACIDVFYDLAFLLMDLVERELTALANIVLNRYLDLTADLDSLSALPLFMSMRAAVRAHVSAALNRLKPSTKALGDAQTYLSLASALLRTHPPCLIAIGGLSGVGKSTVAQALAPHFPPAPGARVIRSDVLRKRLFDVAPETRLPPSAYGADVTERVYRGLHDQVVATLAAGYTAIVDATFLREEERRRVAASAELGGVPFIGLWLEAPRDLLVDRISARCGDASDADIEVLQQQTTLDTGAIDWHRLDATHIAATLADARTLIESARGAS